MFHVILLCLEVWRFRLKRAAYEAGHFILMFIHSPLFNDSLSLCARCPEVYMYIHIPRMAQLMVK